MSERSPPTVPLVTPGMQRSKPIVLHVDDDPASLMMAEGALEDAGFDVVQASDGEQAIDCYRKYEPDLIIMDAVMPVMDGFEAIKVIRLMANGAHIPILMITGLDDMDSITRAYVEGATDFLTKPINFYILPHRVQYMLRSKQTADALRASQAKLDNAQRIAKLGNWEWSLSTNALSSSREFGRVMALEEGVELELWTEFLERVDEADRHTLRLIAEHAVADKQAFSVEFSVSAVPAGQDPRRIRLEAEPNCLEGGECSHMLGTIQDITERINAQQQIHDLAYFDLVTGLPNRAQLNEQMRHTLKLARRNETKFALLFLDLDHFKQVNDTLGHDAGDELLNQVSNRLTTVVRETDMVSGNDCVAEEESDSQHTVARLGGDEFVVLLGQINRPEDAARVAERIAQSVGAPYMIGNTSVTVTTTIGISVFPTDGTTSEALMKNADIAMYYAKDAGRNGFQFYSQDIHNQALARFSLESDLRSAIENEELTLVYQPKLNLHSGEISGVEALLRWKHPDRGNVSPAEFIPLAEETGLILPLGRWVLAQACLQMQRWLANGYPLVSIAVNCSAIQFMRSDMTRDINDAISLSGLDPRCLEIELTESLLLQDIDTGISILSGMKSLGIQLSIDDFGTGFSSLSYLKRLPVDKLKIDRSFIKDLAGDSGDAAIVSSIIALSHNLNLSVVAEGVETQEQMDLLRRFECNEAQGYLIGFPMDVAAFEAWLASRSPLLLKNVVGL